MSAPDRKKAGFPRKYRAAVCGLAFILICGLIWIFGGHKNPFPKISGLEKAEVIRVIDGDTLQVRLVSGEEATVRLIGVDAPESVHPDSAKNTPEGKAAASFTENLCFGRTVYLEYDAEKEDAYGRRLAYVYLEEGRMLNLLLVEHSYARVMTVEPNTRYASYFAAAERKAGRQ